jgi:type II secretory pathway component GspD/PulD (secretin)
MILRLILVFLTAFVGLPAAKAQETSNVQAPAKALIAPDEVTLEANVVQIILNDEHRSGVDWGAIVSDFHTIPLRKENDPAWSDKKHRLSFGTVSEDDYAVLLDALDTVGQMSQFPQPPLKIIAGVPASIIFSKQDIRVDLLLSRLRAGDLSLRVAPQITVPATEIWNGEKISASVRLHSETKFMIADDTTIVIGGLMKEEEITRKHKFPLLGDIPIVGLVFHYKGRLMQKTETVIFLTVRAKAVESPEEDNLP